MELAAGSNGFLNMSSSGIPFGSSVPVNLHNGDDIQGLAYCKGGFVEVEPEMVFVHNGLSPLQDQMASVLDSSTLSVTLQTSTPWVYQNTPATTQDRHVIALTASVTQDTCGNSAYTTMVTQSGPGVVTPTPVWTSGTMVPPTLSASWTGLTGYLVGGRVNELVTSVGNMALTGSCTVHVVVTGNVGGSASADVTITVRPLGDIAGSGQVVPNDLAMLNASLNAFDITPYTDDDCDLSGDGCVTTADRVLLNLVLNGLPVP
jgi:hypothetical protein